jgi:aminoglycoside phosphotransferase (APT) family kinase protein
VRTPVDSAALAVYDGAAEAATLNRWVDHLLAFDALDADPAAVRALAARIGEQLVDGLGEARLGLSHRDLHDKQLMYSADSDTPGLLDFDTAALADPALDIANLAVHLELRRDQGVLDDAAVRVAKSAICDVVRELDVPEDRLWVYRSSTRLRLTCVYAFRPQWRALANRYIGRLCLRG